MRRAIGYLLLFGMLGIIVNYCVAWSFTTLAQRERAKNPWYLMTVWGDPDQGESCYTEGPGYYDWKIKTRQGRGWRSFSSHWSTNPTFWASQIDVIAPPASEFVPSWGSLLDPRAIRVNDTDCRTSMEAAGWPWLSAYGGERTEYHHEDPDPKPATGFYTMTPVTSLEKREGIVRLTLPSDGTSIALPLRPLWTGLLANTAFYGVILWLLWLLWFTPGTIKRTLRRRYGTCVRCGYDLRGSQHPSCPECGAPT